MNIPKYFRLLLFINENGTKNDKKPINLQLKKSLCGPSSPPSLNQQSKIHKVPKTKDFFKF